MNWIFLAPAVGTLFPAHIVPAHDFRSQNNMAAPVKEVLFSLIN